MWKPSLESRCGLLTWMLTKTWTSSLSRVEAEAGSNEVRMMSYWTISDNTKICNLYSSHFQKQTCFFSCYAFEGYYRLFLLCVSAQPLPAITRLILSKLLSWARRNNVKDRKRQRGRREWRKVWLALHRNTFTTSKYQQLTSYFYTLTTFQSLYCRLNR